MPALAEQAQRALNRRRQSVRRLQAFTSELDKENREGTTPDWPDQAASSGASSITSRLTERERHEISEIDAALERIQQGIWGRCEHCGHAIGTQRLRALPEARSCLSCSSNNAAP
jgi:DnaK suppressor protein